MAEYLRPFADPGEGRRPTLTFPRQIPIDGEPADATEFVRAYGAWLNESEIPKLFLNSDPGMVINDKHRALCRKFHNQREVTVAGLHYIQETSPHEIGRAIAAWYRSLDD
jgi:haloalkane dehalogenase